jgi:hypothetical protein
VIHNVVYGRLQEEGAEITSPALGLGAGIT